MPKRVYSDEDRALVFAALTANNGNVKRTSRDTDIPEQTVRDWKKDWERKGLSDGVGEVLPHVVEDIAEDIKRVRDKALLEIESQIDAGVLKGAALVTAFGVLTDKARVIEGLATDRREVVSTGPTPEEIGQAVGDYFVRALESAQRRNEEIIDAEVVEQTNPELPASTS